MEKNIEVAKRKKLGPKIIVLIVAGVAALLVLNGLTEAGDFTYQFNKLFESQESELIVEPDLEAITAIAGVYEWVRGYYALESANPTFVPIGFDDDSDFGDSAISIFTSHGYFALTFNDRHDPEYYIAVSRGTFDAQSITLDDVSAADKLGMKYSDERVNTSWYRVTMYNTEGFFEEPVKLEAFISYANDDDIVFYWPIREGMPKAEISFVRRTSDALR